MTETSIHDNRLIGYEVDCVGHKIVLHTRFDERGALELTDVIFEGVDAYDFEGDHLHSVLSDAREVPIAQLVAENQALFEEGVRYAWPGPWNDSPEASIRHFESEGLKAFVIGSSYGFVGWVVARSFRLERIA
jgi:hypothetical protein